MSEQPPPAKPNDDPALAMCVLWQTNFDRLEETASLVSQRERAMFAATGDERTEAEQMFQAAARVRDRIADELDTLAYVIFQFKARSFEGAAAKLAVAIRDSQPTRDDPIPPWPYLRSVRADLDRLVATARETPPPSTG